MIAAHDRGQVIQICNGQCDDLRLEESSSDNSYRVRVLDSAGRCVACGNGDYVTNGLSTRLTVSGARVLDIREADDRGDDISVTTDRPEIAAPTRR